MKKYLIYSYAIYLVFIYWFFWIKTDDVNQIQRLNVYEGIIESIECRVHDRKRAVKETYIWVLFTDGRELIKPYPIDCITFKKKSRRAKGTLFEAYFLAGRVVKLKINDIEIIKFEVEKKRVNNFATGLGLLPLFLWGFPKIVMKVRKKLGIED